MKSVSPSGHSHAELARQGGNELVWGPWMLESNTCTSGVRKLRPRSRSQRATGIGSSC